MHGHRMQLFVDRLPPQLTAQMHLSRVRVSDQQHFVCHKSEHDSIHTSVRMTVLTLDSGKLQATCSAT